MKTFIKAFALAVALFVSGIAVAAPPYDIDTVDFTLPTTGGAVDTIELLVDGVAVGTITEADQSITAAIAASGTYTFQLRFSNAAGSSLSNSIVRTLSEIEAPGDDGQILDISFSCDSSNGACVLVIS